MTLLSLCIADLITSIMATSIALNDILSALNIAKAEWSELVAITGFSFSNGTSCFHILFIAMQRLCVVMFPLRFKRLFTVFRAKLALVSIWLFTAGLTTFYCFFRKFIFTHSSYILIANCVTLITLYGWLCYKMQKHENDRQRVLNSNRKTNRRIFVHSVAVLSAFIFCSLPFALVFAFPWHVFGIIGYRVGGVMISLNPMLDSLLYFLMSHCRKNQISSSSNGNIEPPSNNVSPGNQQANGCQTTGL